MIIRCSLALTIGAILSSAIGLSGADQWKIKTAGLKIPAGWEVFSESETLYSFRRRIK